MKITEKNSCRIKNIFYIGRIERLKYRIFSYYSCRETCRRTKYEKIMDPKG